VDRDLRSHCHHPHIEMPEVPVASLAGATKPDEGKPARHAPMPGGLEHAARQEQELREIDR